VWYYPPVSESQREKSFDTKGSATRLTFDGVRDALLSAFPELLEPIWNTFGSTYDLERGTPEETPETYPVFEDVVKKLMFELLESGRDEALLIRLFLFFEDLANSPDPNVSRDLLGIAILDPLVYGKESLRRAWRYMGPERKNWPSRQQTTRVDGKTSRRAKGKPGCGACCTFGGSFCAANFARE
jgi:hypothetical protein